MKEFFKSLILSPYFYLTRSDALIIDYLLSEVIIHDQLMNYLLPRI